jgi:hypothetical protein
LKNFDTKPASFYNPDWITKMLKRFGGKRLIVVNSRHFGVNERTQGIKTSKRFYLWKKMDQAAVPG